MKEFTNCISQKGENILLKESFKAEHSLIFWNLIFYFKLMRLPCFFLDQLYNPAYIYRNVAALEVYQPIEKLEKLSKKSSTSSKGPTLNQEALRKLNEASVNNNDFDFMGKTVNRPPSLYEGAMGGMASDSIAIDTFSCTDSVVKPRRPGSVVNYGRSSSKRSRRGSISQRSNSGSQVGSVSDMEKIEGNKKKSSANKYITKYFSKYWEEFRHVMHLKNQDITLSELNFDDMPEELAKQFSKVRKDSSSNLGNTQTELANKIPKERNQDFKADDIISSMTLQKMTSTNTEVGKFKPPEIGRAHV